MKPLKTYPATGRHWGEAWFERDGGWLNVIYRPIRGEETMHAVFIFWGEASPDLRHRRLRGFGPKRWVTLDLGVPEEEWGPKHQTAALRRVEGDLMQAVLAGEWRFDLHDIG